jgi:hypothetical protein
MDAGCYTVSIVRTLGGGARVVRATPAAEPRHRSCDARRTAVPERTYRHNHLLDVVVVVAATAKVVGARRAAQFSPTTPQMYHRLKVTTDGHSRSSAPANRRTVPARGVLRGSAPRTDADTAVRSIANMRVIGAIYAAE